MSKLTSDRNQKVLLDIAAKPGNDACADCKARQPRWASYSLGIFICVNCASIHRKIGTHITKVKSLTMDSWTKEQVERMREIGNVKSNALYNPNEMRHPPPTNLMEVERASELETYIRSKYEFKRFLQKYGVPKLGPSQSVSSVSTSGSTRSVSTPLAVSASTSINNAASKPPSQNRPSAVPASSTSQSRTVSQPLSSTHQQRQPLPPQTQQHPPLPTPQQPAGGGGGGAVWADLVSLQAPTQNSSLPLQIQVPPPQAVPVQQSLFAGGLSTYQTGMPVGPFQQQLAGTAYPQQQQQQQQHFSTTALPQQHQLSAFSAGMPSYTPSFANQQPGYVTQQQPQPSPATQPQFLQPQPQSQQAGFMPGQGQFLSSSPAMQPFVPSSMSSTPQTVQPVHSTTPQLQPMHNQFMPPSPQIPMQGPGTGMGMGMGFGGGMGMVMGGGQPQFLATTPQPQMQQAGYFMPQQPQMVPGGQFGGFQAPFATGAFAGGGGGGGGRQWGAM